MPESGPTRSAQRVVDGVVMEGVPYIFGVPGAKIDQVYDALVDGGPELVTHLSAELGQHLCFVHLGSTGILAGVSFSRVRHPRRAGRRWQEHGGASIGPCPRRTGA